jgi:hypothetical protein
MSRNKHVIGKRDRERLVKERRARKLEARQEKAARRRDGRADAPAARDVIAG